MSFKTRIIVSAVGIALASVGCSKIREITGPKPPRENEFVDVSVYEPKQDGETSVTVVVKADHPDAKLGLKELQNKNYSEAIAAFKRALADPKFTSKRDEAHYGLGVAYEKTDQLALALAEYQKANIDESKQVYQQAQDRVRDKMPK